MLRQALVALHRWFGLGAAAFLFTAGATGAVIAWDHELDAWLNPGFFRCTTPGPRLDPLTLADRVEAADPRVQVRYLPLFIAPGHSLDLFVAPRIDPATGLAFEPGYDQVAVDPVTGAVLGRREWGRARPDRLHLIPFLYRLHYDLHLPPVQGLQTGTLLMGGIAVAWVLDCLVALWLAFPRARDWRKSFAFRWAAGGPRLRFDLHRSGGTWLFPLLGITAVTSVAMNLENEVLRPVVALFSPLTPSPLAGPRSTPPASAPSGAPALTLAQAVQVASAEAARRGWVEPAGAIASRSRGGVHSIAFFSRGGVHGDGGLGPAWLHLDASDGTVLGAEVPGAGSAGDVFMQSMLPLHSGRLFGLPGRILLSLLGVAVAALSVTGVLLWARKRRARAAHQHRRPLASLQRTPRP